MDTDKAKTGAKTRKSKSDCTAPIVKSRVLTPELQDEIIARLSDGEPLRQICRDDHMPSWRTVYDLKDADEGFAARIARARELGEEAIFQDCLHIADNTLEGVETEESENGVKVKRADMLGHRKLQIETRLKLLAKWNPKKWGDKVQIGGAPDLPPMQSNVTIDPGEAYKRLLNPEAGNE